MKESKLCIAYTKSFELKTLFDCHFDSKIQILINPSQLSGTSSEIFQFVSKVHANFYETFPICYHSLHV